MGAQAWKARGLRRTPWRTHGLASQPTGSPQDALGAPALRACPHPSHTWGLRLETASRFPHHSLLWIRRSASELIHEQEEANPKRYGFQLGGPGAAGSVAARL